MLIDSEELAESPHRPALDGLGGVEAVAIISVALSLRRARAGVYS
jgi:hypothetical protein